MVSAVTLKTFKTLQKQYLTKDKVVGILMPEKNNFLV
jgi:hypothetical protein